MRHLRHREQEGRLGESPQKTAVPPGLLTWQVAVGLFLALTAAGCQTEVRPSGDASLPAATNALIVQKVSASDAVATIVGTASCSSRGCHGRLADPADSLPTSSSSYSRWLRDDPHAAAFQSLSSPLAATMAKKLGMSEPAKEPRCLACHTTPQAAADAPWAKDERLFGAGCESCHGAATRWLEPHKSKIWSGLTGADKEKLQSQWGMKPLGNLRARALVCAGCHVGAPAKPEENLPLRDIDHDLIAAGHPRLTFELGAYLANEPKHWIEKSPSAGFEARAWALGQLASAEAALTLLIDRAESQRNWPEFAEDDCFACHHQLYRPSWRQTNLTSSMGKLRLNRWNFGLLDLVSDKPFPLEAIDKTLERGLPTTAAETAKEARLLLALVRKTGVAIEQRSFFPESLAQLRAKLASRGAEGTQLGWDELEQIALGIKAVVASERAPVPSTVAADPLTKIDSATDALLRKLAFPTQAKSPWQFRRTPGFDKDLSLLFESLR